jgi:hypothetical protein
MACKDGAPVVYGGLVFVVSGNNLICYDAVPSRDLDGDGRADDGIPDYERGESFDKVWEVNLGGQSSPPVVVETPSGLQVVVLVGTQVRGYWALPRNSQGRIPQSGATGLVGELACACRFHTHYRGRANPRADSDRQHAVWSCPRCTKQADSSRRASTPCC